MWPSISATSSTGRHRQPAEAEAGRILGIAGHPRQRHRPQETRPGADRGGAAAGGRADPIRGPVRAADDHRRADRHRRLPRPTGIHYVFSDAAGSVVPDELRVQAAGARRDDYHGREPRAVDARPRRDDTRRQLGIDGVCPHPRGDRPRPALRRAPVRTRRELVPSSRPRSRKHERGECGSADRSAPEVRSETVRRRERRPAGDSDPGHAGSRDSGHDPRSGDAE